ncbi:MAG: preprotein translocase subunit TatA [Gammaproteobacteria bacterium]
MHPTINYKFTYPELTRIEDNGMRFYVDSKGNPVPSVTTVLDVVSDKTAIKRWEYRVGKKAAEEIKQQSTDIGTMVHEAIEQYLLGNNWDVFAEDNNSLLAKGITERFIDTGLSKINEIWGLEAGLLLDDWYAGTADCIAIYNDKPAIIDFKTAKKLKRKDWIENYFLQGAAYANAHNVMFDTNIEEIVILMVDRDLLFKEFHIRRDEFAHYTKIWKTKLLEFFNYRREQ